MKTYKILTLSDLYFLIRYACNRPDLENEWVLARCREVQQEPNGYLDLWAREHYKSSIITFGLTIYDILNDPEITIGIFSHTRPIAKGFLRQIKREFESNERLKTLFPEIVWQNPDKEAPKWSEDDGLIVKRTGNPKESTVEAWGIVDSQPTGKHFKLMVYDDVVTLKNVTPDMIAKTTEAFSHSLNLGSRDGNKKRFIGTRYHFNDTYKFIIDSKLAIERRHAATDNGLADGNPVLLTTEQLSEKKKQGPYIFSSQMLLNPVADQTQGFREEWLSFGEFIAHWQAMNRYIVVDPANEKKKTSDYTAIWVIGLGEDSNYYMLDIYRDRLNLSERGDLLFLLHRKWKPRAVGYEKYGMQADIEHFKDRMKRENYRFGIKELGGSMAKNDRIRRLIPLYLQNRIWFSHMCVKTDYEGRSHDLVNVFIQEEFKAFPVGLHDDMLDAQSRILDMDLTWPTQVQQEDRYSGYSKEEVNPWV